MQDDPIDVLVSVPLEPQPQARGRAFSSTGKDGRTHARVHTEKKHARWQAMLAEALDQSFPIKRALQGPIRMDLLLVRKRPKALLKYFKRARATGHGDGHWKHPTGLIWHWKRPDRDNMEKAVADAVKTFWGDDAQVCSGESLKVYHEAETRPRVVLRLRECAGDDPEVRAAELGLIPKTPELLQGMLDATRRRVAALERAVSLLSEEDLPVASRCPTPTLLDLRRVAGGKP